MKETTQHNWIKWIAKAGLFAKGLVYCLIGCFAFMAAFHIKGQSANESDKAGLIRQFQNQPGGKLLLIILAIGLLCYCCWRFIQTFLDTENKGNNAGGIGKRFSYFFSGLTYLSVFYLILKTLITNARSKNNSKPEWISFIADNPAGVWVLAAVGLVFAGIGVYQFWYGTSEKYKKHVNLQKLDENSGNALLRAGKIGYIARGTVWMLISFLFIRAALHHNFNEAGDTGAAFTYVQSTPFGSYLLALLAVGLICYGVMNFIRSAFEKI